MDLKTYAVHRKLRYDDDLLSYVVSGEPIPVSVVEASFEGFIAPLADKKSERLITDFPGMLAAEVPVVMSKNEETGGYEVSGNIPDTLVDAITTVHHITPDDVVAALVDHNLMTVHGKSCKILGTSLAEQAERTMLNALAIPDVVPVHEMLAGDTDITPDSVYEKPDYIGEEPQKPMDFEEAAQQIDANVKMLEGVAADMGAIFDGLQTDGAELPDDIDIDGLAQDIMDEGVEASDGSGFDADSFDAGDIPDEAVMPAEGDIEPIGGDEDEVDLSGACRRIYDKLCADIREYGLDTRLNLVM